MFGVVGGPIICVLASPNFWQAIASLKMKISGWVFIVDRSIWVYRT